MTDTLWLASYPKSGNTFIRLLVALLLDMGPKLEAIPSFGNKLPKVLPSHSVLGRQLTIVKTHLRPNDSRAARLGFATAGAITIQRHPLDVLLSATNYLYNKRGDTGAHFKNGVKKSVEQILADGEIDFYIDRFIENGGVGRYLAMSGPWSGFQTAWDNALSSHPHLRLRFEDVVANPRQAVVSLQEFLGVRRDLTGIDTILAIADRETAPDGRFFWKRRAYNFMYMLDRRHIRRFCEMMAGELSELGYSVHSGPT